MPSNINLGANLPVVFDWQGTNIFTNLIQQSRPLSSFEDPAEIPAIIPRDANGNPTAPFGMVVKAPLRDGDEGEYRIRFKGKASVATLPASITVQNQRTEGAWQVADLTIPASALTTQPGFGEPIFMLRFDNLQGEAVSDISVVKKDLLRADGTFPTFHPVWVQHLRRFKVLRFMNWMSFWLPMPEMNWADRPKKDAISQAHSDNFGHLQVRGVAPEYLVELAKEINCDVWINIPPLATNDYVLGLANLLKNELPATAKIYVEYGNEIWSNGAETDANWQGNRNRDLAAAEVAQGGSNLNHDGATDPSIWAIRRYARRTKEIGDLFVGVFGATSRNTRVRPVYCYQSVNPAATLEPGLAFLENRYGPVKNSIWGISPKTAVDEGSINKNREQITKEDLVQSMRESLNRLIGGFPASDSQTPLIEEAAATAAWHDLGFALYEGGIGLTSTSNVRTEVAFDMMTNPETGWGILDLCNQYLSAWFAYGNDNPLCWFIAGASDWKGANFGNRADIHGLTWNIRKQNTFPIQALDQALQREGGFETTAGAFVPGVLDTRRHVGRTADWNRSNLNNRIWYANGKLYLIFAETEKNYSIRLVSERNADSNYETDIWINRVKAKTIKIPKGRGSHTSTAFSFKLRKGMNALRLDYKGHASGNYRLIIR